MTHLRILTPVVVDHYVVPGAPLRDPAAYAAFWAEAQGHVDALLGARALNVDSPGPAVTLLHSTETSALNRYRSIGDGAVDRPLHVISGVLQPHHVQHHLDEPENPVLVGLRNVSFRLHDHGLMILEAVCDVSEYLTAHPDDVEARLDELQEQAVETGDALASVVVAHYVDPVLTLLRDLDRGGDYLEPATPSDDPQFSDFGHSLWVTRSLVVDPSEATAERTVRHWIKDVALTETSRPPADEILDGERDHLVRWLNYLFYDRNGDGPDMQPGSMFHDQWDALRYAQVFYGSVDRIDSRLSRILADSASADSRVELQRLKDDLTRLSRRAELIILERQDLAKYLKRSVRLELDALMGYWDYEQLLEEPVRFKIDLANQRLAELGAQRTARSAMFTDVILLSIAMTSVLATALALTEFGRSVASDPNMAVYDFGRSSIVAWVASQPADAILISSGAVSALIVLVYLFFRRNNNS
ncbi:hypothetical protein [Myceligenerans crystallogenes]|uniref:CorA-like Mg2+ transporter protein n=1 Tax=Myceligenerans crystallogenes TaxID=316335 RepID=A0ABN2N6J1_9MICO